MFTKSFWRRAALICGLALLALFVVPPQGQAHAAGTIVVNTLADETTPGDGCSLREAITNANNNAQTYSDCAGGGGTDTVTFGVSGTITLASTLPDITIPIMIDGRGQSIVISGNNAVRVFHVASGGNLTLNTLTIQNAYYSADWGGGILNQGTLTVSNSTFSNNSAAGFGGGGIANQGTLTVSSSTFSGNSVPASGGGIFNIGTLTVSNSTFSGNSAYDSGGGIVNWATATVSNSTFSGNSVSGTSGNRGGGAIGSGNWGTLTVTGSTFSGNTAGVYAGAIWDATSAAVTVSNSTFSGNSAQYGGGIFNGGDFGPSPLTVSNSTLSGNSALGYGGGIVSGNMLNLLSVIVAGNTAPTAPDISGSVTSVGYNLVGKTDGSSATWQSTDQTGTSGSPLDAKLNALAGNGGSTQTMSLQSGSSAIGNGFCGGNSTVTPPAPAVTTDQRGVARKNPCDVGAFESSSSVTTLVTAPQAMEGDLKVYPGDTLQVGYDFTMPGNHPAVTLSFVGSQVTFQYTCVSGTGSGSFVVPMPDQSYTDPQNSSSWYPSGDQHNSLVFQGSLSVSDVCSRGLVRLNLGGTFTSGVTSTGTADKVNLRWHYSANGSAGGWSGTKSIVPN